MNNQKNIYVLFTFIFITVNAFAFSQEPAVKIYLEDGFSQKNVKNAKVTLEGFELPQIIGKYNKKGQYYYFDTIPNGYNTVMAYHKKYNEKGFQDLNELPKEIKLKLYYPDNIVYDFDKYPEEIESLNENDSVDSLIKNKGQFVNLYVEDPYKIFIRLSFKVEVDGFENKRDSLIDLLKPMKLGLELINPFMEYNRNATINDLYPVCEPSEGYFTLEWLNEYPQCKNIPYNGLPLVDAMWGDRQITTEDVGDGFYFMKVDKTHFKRYNDPIIQKLLELEGITVEGIIYSIEHYRGKEFYNYKKNGRKNNKYRLSDKENSYMAYKKNEVTVTVPIEFGGVYGLGVMDIMELRKINPIYDYHKMIELNNNQ